MAILNWLYKSGQKEMVVKIIHRGGHVELYDRPVLAKEILVRKPKFCVAHTNIFKQPWAVVSPETTLMPGQIFYLVRTNTIRKLQNMSTRHSHSLFTEIQATGKYNDQVGNGEAFTCWMCTRKNKDGKRKKLKHKTRKDSATKTKGSSENQNNKLKLSSSSRLAKGMSNLRNKKGDFPKSLMSLDSWEPSLQSIVEE